jgi:hypothetical protein
VIIEVPEDLSKEIQPMPLTVIFNPQLGKKIVMQKEIFSSWILNYRH